MPASHGLLKLQYTAEFHAPATAWVNVPGPVFAPRPAAVPSVLKVVSGAFLAMSHASVVVRRAASGEEGGITDRGRLVAKLVPLSSSRLDSHTLLTVVLAGDARFVERLRSDEFLALEEFETLSTARRLTAPWKEDDNHHRPHRSLGYVTLAVFPARCAASTPENTSPTAQPSLPSQPHNGTYISLGADFSGTPGRRRPIYFIGLSNRGIWQRDEIRHDPD